MNLPIQLEVVLGDAQRRGLLGAASLQSHAEHAAAFVDAGGEEQFREAAVLDLGSGGGIPGLVIAASCPTARLTLLDGRAQRTEFLREAVERLGWTDRVCVTAARAEEAGRNPLQREAFDVVVARGFGAPAVTAECAAPLVRIGGIVVVSEPPGAVESTPRWSAEGCAVLGLVLDRLVALPWSFAILRKTSSCPDRYPRRVGIPGKRPLF